MKFETERLIIRPINLDDKFEIFAYRSDSETNKYQGWIPKTINDVEAFIEKISTQINEPETWFQFVIIEKETQKIVGDIGIHFFDRENKQTGIGYTLNKDFHGKGYIVKENKITWIFLF
jgi:RimJ/RimL family protein N-acetyltransferase